MLLTLKCTSLPLVILWLSYPSFLVCGGGVDCWMGSNKLHLMPHLLVALLQCDLHEASFEEYPETSAGTKCSSMRSHVCFWYNTNYIPAVQIALVTSLFLGPTEGAVVDLQSPTWIGLFEGLRLPILFVHPDLTEWACFEV